MTNDDDVSVDEETGDENVMGRNVGRTVWAALADELVYIMEDAFGDAELWQAVKPIIPVIAVLAVDEGLDVAMETLEGLAGDEGLFAAAAIYRFKETET